MKNINTNLILVSKLEDILKQKNVTQKQLAKMIGEREASVSELINLRRSSVNINLLSKIATALDISSMDDIFQFKYVFGLKNYEQKTFYEFSSYPNLKFSYISNHHEVKFETVEILSDVVLLNNQYDLLGKAFNDIELEYNSLNLGIKEDNLPEEELLVSMLIELCRYRGIPKINNRYKTKEEAIEVMNMLF